jgi:hypothetical protein
MGSKCCNMLNVLFHFYMLNRFVGHGRLDWGFKASELIQFSLRLCLSTLFSGASRCS